MLVVFRADASIQIGSGHVMRCLALAEELRRQDHQCRFICRDLPGHLGELIEGKGFELHLLLGSESLEVVRSDNTYAQWLGVCQSQDASQTLDVLATLAADWLVVDHYALNSCWEREVASAVGHIMVIDDLADRSHDCALLLDQNLGCNAVDYHEKVPDDCVCLIGPKYALLRPEFAGLRERSLQRRQRAKLKRLLISLGGMDPDNVTSDVLKALEVASLHPDTELDIIMGASAPYLDDVRQLASQLPYRATVSVNVSDMAERMYRADLSIGGGGGTSWERCCLGLPAVVVILAENQVSGAKALEAEGAAIVIGGGEQVCAALPAALVIAGRAGVLQRMSCSAARVSVGDGAVKAVAAMMDTAWSHE